jgi:hypothetical protein
VSWCAIYADGVFSVCPDGVVAFALSENPPALRLEDSVDFSRSQRLSPPRLDGSSIAHMI